MSPAAFNLFDHILLQVKQEPSKVHRDLTRTHQALPCTHQILLRIPLLSRLMEQTTLRVRTVNQLQAHRFVLMDIAIVERMTITEEMESKLLLTQ